MIDQKGSSLSKECPALCVIGVSDKEPPDMIDQSQRIGHVQGKIAKCTCLIAFFIHVHSYPTQLWGTAPDIITNSSAFHHVATKNVDTIDRVAMKIWPTEITANILPPRGKRLIGPKFNHMEQLHPILSWISPPRYTSNSHGKPRGIM